MRRGLPDNVHPEQESYSLYEGVDYEKFWEGQQKQHLDVLEKTLVTDLLPSSGRRIVDVGCGFGRLADCYIDRFQQTVMVDGSISLLHQAREKTAGKAIYIASDASRLPFKSGSFDAVLLVRVFHHIDDSQGCLAELNRVLSYGGRLILNYCNKRNPDRILKWIMGRGGQNPFTKEPDDLGTTFISHHPKSIDEMLKNSGFSKNEYFGTGVMDKLALQSRPIFSTRLAREIAPFLAWSNIAPWIFCQAWAFEPPADNAALENNDFLQCPVCTGSLAENNQSYKCNYCNNSFPVEDGIIDLRIK